jgi:hypothetical protein
MFSFLALSKPTLGVVPVTNQFAWGVGMGCAQGSDVIGMRMIGAWNAPSGRCHIVERRTQEFCVPNIFKRPRLPRATCS